MNAKQNQTANPQGSIKVGDTLRWQNGAIIFEEVVYKVFCKYSKTTKLAVRGVSGPIQIDTLLRNFPNLEVL